MLGKEASCNSICEKRNIGISELMQNSYIGEVGGFTVEKKVYTSIASEGLLSLPVTVDPK